MPQWAIPCACSWSLPAPVFLCQFLATLLCHGTGRGGIVVHPRRSPAQGN